MRTRFFLAVSLALLYTSFSSAIAQQTSASITGIVRDQTGAAVPGVSVTLQNAATEATYKTVTNATGSYMLTAVKPGPGYEIKFTRSGFKCVAISGVYMNVDATRSQNARLTIGEVEQTITVSAADQDVTLDITDAMVGNNFQVQFLNNLPVENRDSPAALFTQQPGVTLDGSVTGARLDQDRVTLDGLDVNDMATGQFGAIIGNAPVDSVQEFRGVVTGELANANSGGGGQYHLITRSGSNQFHGSVVEYHRDTDLEANSWFNNNAGVGRPPLIRNQFGGNIGGPMLKNKLFFFFDYDGRRDTLSNLENRTVPLNSFRQGTIGYGNKAGTTSVLSSAQIAALDPLKIGFNSALLGLLNSRYPQSNNLSRGNGLNTGGFEFNAPFPYTENAFAQRVDYTIDSKDKLFGVGHFTRTNATQSGIQFPGDPETSPFLDQSYSWVVGYTRNSGGNKVNQAYIGETYEDYSFPITYNPTGANQFETFGGDGTGGSILSTPYYVANNAEGRTYPIPIVHDDFNWIKGKHGLYFGGGFKWPSPNGYEILNYNTPAIGLSGYTSSLNSTLRPSDIASGNATALFDSAFALALAPYTSVGATYVYNAQGAPQTQGTAQSNHYQYYETELYFGDTWKVTPFFTLAYGLRWQYFSVPYDKNGLQSIAVFASNPSQPVDFNTYFGDRLAQSAAGQTGNQAIPLIAYALGGKKNNGPGYYQPDYRNWAPNVAFAWNPSSSRDTVFNGGAGIVYDETVINAVQYQQSLYSYIFQASASKFFGTQGDPVGALTTDPRFAGLNSPPAPASAPTITKPYLPYASGTGSSAVPYGLPYGEFNQSIDSRLRTPYSIQYNFGMQHEFPHGYILRATYVGRLGRRLLAQADASQLIDFPDKQSGQLMSQAFGNLSLQARSNGVITTQPWFEDVLKPGVGAASGIPGVTNNTQLVNYYFGTYVARGDFADTMQGLSSAGLLPPNVGMDSQFAENTFYTNKGFSTYNGLLTTLHKNLSYGLQFDINYTWSHSIDNVSLIANKSASSGYGFICDAVRPRACRGNSDFDVTHNITGNFIYDLPFGRGRRLATQAPFWLNELVGGWSVSGLPGWHTGYPFFAAANAFVAGFANDAPAILTGPISDLKVHLTGGHGVPLNIFANPARAAADFTGPIGFQLGSRNNLRGPGFFDFDLGLGKTFPIYEGVNLKFRVDAFNALNHPDFDVPTTGTDITDSAVPFGTISGLTSRAPFSGGNAARVLQAALRLEF